VKAVAEISEDLRVVPQPFRDSAKISRTPEKALAKFPKRWASAAKRFSFFRRVRSAAERGRGNFWRVGGARKAFAIRKKASGGCNQARAEIFAALRGRAKARFGRKRASARRFILSPNLGSLLRRGIAAERAESRWRLDPEAARRSALRFFRSLCGRSVRIVDERHGGVGLHGGSDDVARGDLRRFGSPAPLARGLIKRRYYLIPADFPV
jgi:hypothetical protein